MNIQRITKLLALFLLFSPAVSFAVTVIDDSKSANYLFTLAAKSGTYEGDVLTLNDAPLVIYFADRPVRKAGHLTLEQFAKLWTTGDDAFEKDPPSAQLTILDKDSDNDGGIGVHSVVILENPKVEGDNISFTVRIIEGEIPASFDKVSLYLDSLGVQKSPSF